MPEKKRNLGIRVTEEVRKRLHHLTTDLDVSVQQFVETAIDRYMLDLATRQLASNIPTSEGIEVSASVGIELADARGTGNPATANGGRQRETSQLADSLERPGAREIKPRTPRKRMGG